MTEHEHVLLAELRQRHLATGGRLDETFLEAARLRHVMPGATAEAILTEHRRRRAAAAQGRGHGMPAPSPLRLTTPEYPRGLDPAWDRFRDQVRAQPTRATGISLMNWSPP